MLVVGSEDELVAKYDPSGCVIGSVPRHVMRRRGLWHAAASVLVRSTDGASVYVHRRTDTKDIYPGMHDCWAGGVVAAGEDPAITASRELAEELGIRGVQPRFLFRSVHERGSVRFHGFLYEVHWDGACIHQPTEIAAGWWMSLVDLRARLADPEWPFVPDGRQFVDEWFARYG